MADVEGEGHVCKECGKSYNKNWRLVEHIRSHTGERPFKCTFEGCGKSFIRPYHLKRHSVIHTGQEPFSCSYPGCTKTFSMQHSLNRHMKRSHDNPFKCHYDECHQSFKKSSQLSRHICEVHTKESRFKCQVEGCNAGFNLPSKLKRHMEKHSRGYICSTPGCSATFDKFSKLRMHMRSHGYTCRTCNKTFSKVWELKQHAIVHDTNRKMYECPREGCNRVYTKAFTLRAHIKSFHEGIKPYVCTWEGCGKGFVYKVSLKQHLVLHSQRRIKPAPSPEERALLKKKKKRPSLAKQLSGYRSSLSESSDTHCTETAPRKRKTPNQTQRNEIQSVMSTKEVTSVHTLTGEAGQSEDSVVVTTNQDRSEGVQVDASSSGTSASPCINSATTSTYQGLSEEVQDGVSTVASLNLVVSSGFSVTTPTSGNFQEQAPDAFADDIMFSSSDEDEEVMDWEQALADNLEVHSPLQCDLEPKSESERITEDAGVHGVNEDSPRDKRSSREPAENGSTYLPPNGNEVVSTALSAVSDSDSSEDDLPLSLLSKASNLVNKTNASLKKRQKTKKMEGKRMKKSSDMSQSGAENVADLSSRLEEIVKVHVLPPADLTVLNGDIRKGVNVLESTDFPDMDDVLQVIIEEEEESEVDSLQFESSRQHENVNVEEGYNDVNIPCYASQESNNEISSEKQVGLSPRQGLNLEGRSEFGSHEKISKNDGALSDKEDVVTVDSFNEVSNDCEITSGVKEGGASEQKKPAQDASPPSRNDACDHETPKVDKSRGLTRGQSGIESQESCDRIRDEGGSTSLDLTGKVNHAEDLCPSVKITTNSSSVPKELPTSSSKRSKQKPKHNDGAKRYVNKSISCSSGTPKSQGKSPPRVNRVNRKNSEVDDVATETGEKPLKEEPDEDVSKAKFRSRNNLFACDMQTLELLWNFKGR